MSYEFLNFFTGITFYPETSSFDTKIHGQCIGALATFSQILITGTIII